MIWRCRDRVFDVGVRTLVVGIVNVTPDSFSDGGRTFHPEPAIAHARRLAAEGADLIDLGAESTRPGSEPVAQAEQIRRLSPVFAGLAGDDLCLSVDTTRAGVAAMALEGGARIINDVTALGEPAMAALAARSGAGVILMHMAGTPKTMQQDPRYDDVAAEVAAWLQARLGAAAAAGLAPDTLAVDPGIGFGKTARHSLELIARLERVVALGRPVLVGLSRKSFLGKPLDLPVDQRLEAGLAATAVAVFAGARIVRTHDVAATVRAVRTADALRAARGGRA